MTLWGLASLKFIEQLGRLEIQVRVDVAALRLKSARAGQVGWILRQGFYVAVLRLNSFFFRKPQSLFLRPSTDWASPSHIMEVITQRLLT